MLRRRFLQQSLAPLALTAQGRRKPNIVFLMADDLGWADLGCYGSTFYESPVLDRFAKQGIRFTQAYTAGTVCSPTRSSIMTGQYPARVGITDYIPGLHKKDQKLLDPMDRHELPLDHVTVAEALKEGGYRTYYSGKWHLGEKGHSPLEQGFDKFADRVSLGFRGAGYSKGNEWLTDRLTDEALGFIDDAGRDPFFLFLSFHAPHTPIQACPRHIDRFRKKAAALPAGPGLAYERKGATRQRQDWPEYASMIYAMDENVGRVLARLDEKNLAGETIVVFTSDNGGLCTHQNPDGGPTSNLPLRSGKGWCYEGGIRVPLMVRAPGVTKAGAECAWPVISTDYYPTLLELAGERARPSQHADGLSAGSLLRGGAKTGRDTLYWHYPHYHGSTSTPSAAMRQGNWKLIDFYDEDKRELYDLSRDPGEQQDLAAKDPGRVKKMATALAAWQKSVGAQMPTPNPARKV